MKNKVTGLKIVSALGYLGSWYLSYKLSTALCFSLEEKIMSAIIVTVMQAFVFIFYYYKKYTIAFTLLFISIIGNVTFWYNQNNEHLENKLKNNDIISSQKSMNENKINFIGLGNTSKQAIESDYNESIKEKEAEILSIKEQIEVEKIETKQQIESYNKKSDIGSWHKGQNEEKQNKLLVSKINNLNTKIDTIHQQIDKLRENKREDIKNLTSDLKESASSISEIDYTKASETIVYSKGYLGIMNTVGIWTGIKANTLILIFLMLFGVSFEWALIQGHLLILEIQGIDYKAPKSFSFKKIINKTSGAIRSRIKGSSTSSAPSAKMGTYKSKNTDVGQCEIIEYDEEIEVEPKGKIGFKVSTDNEKIKKYIPKMLELMDKKTNISIGCKKVCLAAGLEEKDSRDMLANLKMHKIVEVVEGNSIVNVKEAQKWL